MSKISIKTDFADGQKLYGNDLNNNFKTIEAGINANDEQIGQHIEEAAARLRKELEDITEERGWDWNGGERVTFYKGNTAQVNAEPISNGKLLYNTETGETALDDDGKRVITGSGNVVSTDSVEPTNEATKLWVKEENGKANLLYKKGENWEKVDQAVGGDTLPIGSVVEFAGSIAPTNWLFVDTNVRKSDYPELYAVIGDTYNDSTTPAGYFKVYNKKGLVTLGINVGDEHFNEIGKTYGEYEHTLDADEISTTTKSANLTSGSDSVYTVSATLSHNNIQPSVAGQFICKAKQSIGLLGNITTNIDSEAQDAVATAKTVKDYVNTKSQIINTTEEQQIGYHLGKPLFKKTIVYASGWNIGATTYMAHNLNLGELVDVCVVGYRKSELINKATTLYYGALPTSQLGWVLSAYDFGKNSFTLYVGSNHTGANALEKVEVTVEYTKAEE